jgi:hypothetical protein
METLVSIPHKSSSARVQPYNLKLHQRSIHIFDPISIENKVRKLKLESRVDNLFILLDQSSDMNESYRNVNLRLYAREIARRFLKTMPKKALGGGFWVIDERIANESKSNEFTTMKYLAGLDSEAVLDAIGTDQLAEAIDLINERVSQKQNRSAVLILTRWDRIDRSVEEAVLRLHQRQLFETGQNIMDPVRNWQGGSGQGVCVYTLGVGNRLSRTPIDQVDTCGFSAAADKVAQPRDMTHFVERLLYIGPTDTDADGIADYKDQCPGTVPNRIVNFNGCPQFEHSGAGS